MRSSIQSSRVLLEIVSHTRSLIQRRLISFYGVVCITLALSVFAWGTSYKLSLYTTHHQSSPAKLCTRGSSPAKSALNHAVGAGSVAPASLRMAIFFSLPQRMEVLFFDRLGEEAVSDLSPLGQAPILYLRPPPDEGRSVD